MKKGIAILLIMALVAGSVFAGKLTGSAQIDFGYNLDTTDWGFKNGQTSKYTFSFEFDTTKVEIADHTTELWAEIAASASATLSQANAAATADNIKVSAAITKANIHIGEWTIGILGSGSTADYAASYWLDDDGNPVVDILTAKNGVFDGFTVAWKGWNAGFGANGNIDGKVYNLYGHGETPAFKFAEDAITVQAAGYLIYANDSSAGASVKASYAADKLNAAVAADAMYDNGAVVFEVAANAAYDFVSAAVYVAPGKAMGLAGYTDELSLNALVAAEYEFEPVLVSAYVDARDVLVDGREIYVGAAEEATFGEVAVEASEDFAVFAKTLAVSAKATHDAEKFTAYVKVGANFAFGASKVLAGIPFEYGISSTAVVENATLSLTYKGADLADFSNKMGAITATAKIAF